MLEASCLTCFSWNIEGLRRNIHSLKHFIGLYDPHLIFLSEPQIFQCDIDSLFKTLEGQFSFHLNSEDLLHPELALEHHKAKGGTLALWTSSLDPYVTVIPTLSSSVLAIALAIPNLVISCHICIYLPTAGQENEFFAALSCLDNCLTDLDEAYGTPHIYIKGDANVNPRNTHRAKVFNHLIDKHNLDKLELLHPTYHHFLGQGEFDSPLDVLLHVKHEQVTEILFDIICKHQDPLIQSHHDLIISSVSLPRSTKIADDNHKLVRAPRVDNSRVKIIWTDEGIENYKEAVADNLTRLRNTWCQPSSPALMSILLASTYSLLSTAAASTNKAKPLDVKTSLKSREHPAIEAAKKTLLMKHKT